MERALPFGVILAGGASSRMGGGDKALLELGPAAMLDRVLDRLRPQAAGIVLSANGDPARFERFGLPVIADTADGYLGPLAGIHAGLARAAAAGASEILTVPSDAPFLSLDLGQRLADGRAAPDEIAVAASASGIHPVFALWPVKLEADLARFLDEGGRKVMQFVASRPHRIVTFEERTPDPFFNVNTPQDLAEARRHLAGSAS